MVDFTLFRLREDLGDFDDFVDSGGKRKVETSGPIDEGDFTAKLFFTEAPRQAPPWLSFVTDGFPQAVSWQWGQSLSVLIVVNADPSGNGRYFALAFGTAARHLLRNDAYQRRYGLITALNLVAEGEEQAQILSLDTTRHTRSTLRSRLQTTSASTVDAFELDVLRDLLRRATGRPADIERWGQRVGGSDAVRLADEIAFSDIGNFCRQVDEVATADTYRSQFDWIDNIQPVNEKGLIDQLEEQVLHLLRQDDFTTLQLSPPEVVDWDILSRFQFHFDLRQGVKRNEIFLHSYVAGLRKKDPNLDDLSPATLKSRRVFGLTTEDDRLYDWPVWRCLVGELIFDGKSYVLEDGAFYQVSESYLEALHGNILQFSTGQTFLPVWRDGQAEKEYNKSASESEPSLLLLDAKLVYTQGTTGGIEVCDLLSDEAKLIHVKKYGGSSQLSHLFAQARVSSEALQISANFRNDARSLILARSEGSSQFDLISPGVMPTGDFEIVLAIGKHWGTKDIDSLPFFAKIDLRKTIVDLRSRGYKVSVHRVSIE